MTPKVLILIDTAIIGGPGRGILQLFKHMPSASWEPILCAFAYPPPHSQEFIEEARSRGLPLRVLRQRFPLDPSPLVSLIRIIRQERIQILQTHGYKGHVMGFIARIVSGVKWLAFSHGWTTEDLKVRLYHALDHVTLRYADFAVAVSPVLCEQVRAIRRGKKVHLVVNAVDADEIRPGISAEEVRKQCGVSSNGFLIGCFGRLSSEKGQRILVRAMLQIKREFPETRLVLVGDGPDRAFLSELIARSGLQSEVFMHGYQSGMRGYYEAIDLLVLPSLSEGMPNVALEAMAMQVPVLATKVGAVPEIVSDGKTGWLVKPGNVDELASQCVSIIQMSPERRKGIADTARVSLFPAYDPGRRAQAVSALYKELL